MQRHLHRNRIPARRRSSSPLDDKLARLAATGSPYQSHRASSPIGKTRPTSLLRLAPRRKPEEAADCREPLSDDDVPRCLVDKAPGCRLGEKGFKTGKAFAVWFVLLDSASSHLAVEGHAGPRGARSNLSGLW